MGLAELKGGVVGALGKTAISGSLSIAVNRSLCSKLSKVYIVPPDDTFISELGLPASVKSLAGSLLALQAGEIQ